jgi:predicted nicotinamide N-methyase
LLHALGCRRNPAQVCIPSSPHSLVPAIHEYHLTLAGHTWSIQHRGAILSEADETRYLGEQQGRIPYGVMLWPSSIALAHELVARAGSLAGVRILELGAGTGLPGIVAATYGAHVVQTDRLDVALDLCRRNAERNHVSVEHRVADWTVWSDEERYDLILGADVLYAERLHSFLRHIFETNLAPNGRLLMADPFRPRSMPLLESLAAVGWTIEFSKWTVGESEARLPIGVYDVASNGRATS